MTTGAAARPGPGRLPLGEQWLDAILVYASGEMARLPAGREAEVGAALETYLADHPHSEAGTVWFDSIAGTCFSAAQFRGGADGKEYNFLTPADAFLNGMWGYRYVTGSIGFNETFRSSPVAACSEYIRSDSHTEARVRGRRVLIVLGGPSTRRVPWERIDTDTHWSCNNFYLNRAVSALNLSLVALAPDVPLQNNPRLYAYMDSNVCVEAAFEIDRGGPVGSWRPVNDFVRRYPSRCSFFHTRYQSALGLGTRLLLLAIFMGAAEIMFVGLDGMGPAGPLHAFEPYKENPLWYARYGPNLQRRQYVVFWEYVLSLQQLYNFRLFNLGEGCSLNQSSEISRRHFPLPRPILTRLEHSSPI